MEREMAKAIALYEGGIHGLTERAIRDDGAVFVRYQDKTPWGYRWGAWKATGEVLGHNQRNNPETMIEFGFSKLFINRDGRAARLRLPN